MPARPLLLHNVEIDGRPGLDLRIAGGRIAEIAPGLPRTGEVIDGKGGALIPGLIDHHVHLLATAAALDSVSLAEADGPAALAAALRDAASTRPKGQWLRATGYHAYRAGPLTRDDLDRILPDHPARVQHQTGSLWLLNSRALAALGGGELPPAVERDSAGQPTGRIFRGDDWLRTRLALPPPPLAPVGHALAAAGVIGVTDASVSSDDSAAALFAEARAAGGLPVQMMMMSGGALTLPDDPGITVGPVKIVLDDHALPPIDTIAARIAQARRWGRHVAFHCVTVGELIFALAALEEAGPRPGDRIEHGGVIPPESLQTIRAFGLTVVTQPAFIDERGDRYLAEVDAADQNDLYRCASLRAAGIPVAGSSDTPYATLDPWAGMRAAVARRTQAGRDIGAGERISPAEALALYLGSFANPGGPPRAIIPGAEANLCLLSRSIRDSLDMMSRENVVLTLSRGEITYLKAD
jgi:predicted amidohydrolase YtcJ